jgi:5-methylcytosine-specific restriction endonuclease McrA
MGNNLKNRINDKRGHREWTPEQKEKVRLSSTKHVELTSDWLREQYLDLKKTTVQIAKELGCVPSTIYVALVRFNIPKRSRAEARNGIKFSKEHLENITKANRKMAKKGSTHWNWQGGKTREYEKKMAVIKRDPRYKAWAKAIKSVGCCKSCGATSDLEAHHILPKSTYPHLIHDISNGMCLCGACHANLHSLENGMNSGKLLKDNPEPSRVETRKVQRLPEDGTPSLITGKSVPLVRDDIVQVA